MDQPLRLGDEGDFAFCATYPAGVPSGFDLVFHNSSLDRSKPILRRVSVTAIRHPSLGEVRRVETKGLVYRIELADGAEIQIEAEETPGRIEYMPPALSTEIESWDLEVEVTLRSALAEAGR